MIKFKNKNMVLHVIAFMMIFLVGISISYSYYKANVSFINDTESILKTKKLALLFEDTKKVDFQKFLPGVKVEKTFTVKSDSDVPLTYNIRIKDITNTYADDVVYSLYCDGVKLVDKARVPKTSDLAYIYTNLTINPKETRNYILEFEYLNTDELQVYNADNEFDGTVEIDLKDNIDSVVYTFENNASISNDNKKMKFEIKNISSTTSTKYNVKLQGLVNTYDSLEYTLRKNGTVVSTGIMPKDGQLPYLLLDQEISAGGVDKYVLEVKTDNTKEFSAIIGNDSYDVDTTAPEGSVEFVNKTTNSITYKMSCSDSESGISKYYFYKDGILVTTVDGASEVEYTYTNLTSDEHTFTIGCSNSFGIRTSETKTDSPKAIEIPEITVPQGASTNKEIPLEYTGEGDYIFKVTGNATTDKPVVACTLDGADLVCGNEPVTDLQEGVWYKVIEQPTVVSFESDGTIDTKVTDGTNVVDMPTISIEDVDNTDPEIKSITSGEYIEGQWTNESVTLEIEAEDDKTGVSYIEYNLGEEWLQLTGTSLTIEDDYSGDISFRAIDEALNTSEIVTYNVKIDKVKPTCSIDGNPENWALGATLIINGNDTDSKLAPYPYSWDNVTYDNQNQQIVDTNGEFTAYVIDNAGNIGSCDIMVDKIDTDAPSVSLIEKSKTSNSITLTGSCVDGESGLKKYEFYQDGELKQTYTTSDSTKDNTYTNVTEGNHTFKLTCYDNLDNNVSKSITSSTIDLEVPTYSITSGYAKEKSITINYHNSLGDHLLKVTGSVTSDESLVPCTQNNGTEAGFTCSGIETTSLNSNTWYKVQSSNNPTLTFTSNGNIIARTVDGTNYKAGSSSDVNGIDRQGPDIIFTTSKNETYLKEQSTKVTLDDNASGVNTNSLKYVWTQSTTEPQKTAFTNTFSSGDDIRLNNQTGNNWYLWIYAEDSVENTTVLSAGPFYLDNTAPQNLAISGNPTSWTNRVTLTASATDANVGGVSYTWSSGETTSSIEVTANGTYTVTAKDSLENSTSTNVVVSYIDATPPALNVSVTNGTTYAKTNSATVTLTDTGGSGLTAGTYEIKYAWGTSAIACDSMSSSKNIVVSDGDTSKSITIDITDNVTGAGAIYVCNATAITDKATNSLAAKVVKSESMYLDNTPPTGCSISTITYNPSNTTYANTAVITIPTVSDNNNGTVYYSWNNTNNYSTTKPSNPTISENGTYTLYVKDGLGNSTSCNVTISKLYYKSGDVKYTYTDVPSIKNVEQALDYLYDMLE